MSKWSTLAPVWSRQAMGFIFVLITACGGDNSQDSPNIPPPVPVTQAQVITGVVQDQIGDDTIRVNDVNIRLPDGTLASSPHIAVGAPVRIILSDTADETPLGDDDDDSDDDNTPRPADEIDVIDHNDDDKIRIRGHVTSISLPNFVIDTQPILVGPDTEFELRDSAGTVARTREAFYLNLHVGAAAAAEGYAAAEALLAEEVTVWLDTSAPPAPPVTPPATVSSIILAGPVATAFDATASRITVLTLPIQISATTVIQATGSTTPVPPTALQPGRRIECRGTLTGGVIQAQQITLDAGPQPGGVMINAPLETITVATRRVTSLGLTVALDRGARLIDNEGIARDTASTLAQWRTGERIIALGIPAPSQPRWIHTTTIAPALNDTQTTISERTPVALAGPLEQGYNAAAPSIALAGRTFLVTPQTVIKSRQTGAPLDPSTLTPGTGVSASGFQRDTQITAETIEVFDTPPPYFAVTGPYDAFDPLTRQLNVLGLPVQYSGTTQYFDFAGLHVSLSDFVLAAPAGSVVLASGTRDAGGILHAERLTEIAKVFSESVPPVVSITGTISDPFNLASLSLSVAQVPVVVDSATAVRQPDGTPTQPVAQLQTGDPVLVTGRLGLAGFVADEVVRLAVATGAVELHGPVQHYDATTQTFFLSGQALRVTANTAVNIIGMPPTTANDLIGKLTPWTRLHVLTQVPATNQPSWDALTIEARLFFPHAHSAQITGPVIVPFDPATSTLKVLGTAVAINTTTRISNDQGVPIDASSLVTGAAVTVNGNSDEDNRLVAETINVATPATTAAFRLAGPASRTDPANQTVTVLSSLVQVTAATRLLESVTVALKPQDFWSGISAHSLLQVDGTSRTPNGDLIADQVLVVRY